MKMQLLCASLLVSAMSTWAQTPAFISDSLDAYIKKEMQFYRIPGLAVGIVHNGKVQVQKGYGLRSATDTATVNEHTQFYIASNTKLFTGMALSLLHERGKLNLNDRMQQHMPGFALANAEYSKLVTIRDMLSHRIGTTTFQGDFSFFNTKASRQMILQKMALMAPTQVFRQQYGYCNSCYLAAGELVPIVTGQPWEVFVYDSLMLPSGMKNSHVLSYGYNKMANAARPHTITAAGNLVEVTPDRWDNLAPAASIISNVADMNQWLLFQLANGLKNGKQLLPASVFARTRQVNSMLGNNTGNEGGNLFAGYGLGLFVEGLRQGVMQFRHTGGASGMVSSLAFIPEKKLGVVILTNQDSHPFFELLRQRIVHAYLNDSIPGLDAGNRAGFTEELAQNKTRVNELEARVKAQRQRNQTAPSIAGIYENSLYGTMEITAVKNGYEATFNSHHQLTATLEYMGGDAWLCTYSDPVMGVHPMQFSKEGNATTAKVKVNDFVEYGTYLFYKR